MIMENSEEGRESIGFVGIYVCLTLRGFDLRVCINSVLILLRGKFVLILLSKFSLSWCFNFQLASDTRGSSYSESYLKAGVFQSLADIIYILKPEYDNTQ